MITPRASLASLILDQASDAIIFADLHGAIRRWSAGAETVFGYSRAEAVGRSLDLIIPERFREQHWTGYDRVLATGETKYSGKPLVTRSARKDGSTIYIEMMLAVVKDGDGKVKGVVSVCRDMTERYQRERELRQRLAALEKGAG
jgi:PAS domain S-box-containing protein